MQGYYARLESLRGRLLVSGQGSWSLELLDAEHSAHPLLDVGVVLKRLLDSTELDLADFRDEAQAIYDEGDRLFWDIEK
ncbi:MAG TPA: hypothetical protein VIO85_01720 [Candidatus Dormibacteraeota bacterium]|jgi:hypothetical protein